MLGLLPNNDCRKFLWSLNPELIEKDNFSGCSTDLGEDEGRMLDCLFCFRLLGVLYRVSEMCTGDLPESFIL